MARGGEVLKFMGDGLLAIFGSRTATRRGLRGGARGGQEALALMDALATRRRGRSRPTPELDIALHVGHVNYGNVGADARLDFTVIGPAVNEASRIERLCEALGRHLLMSQAFAQAAEPAAAAWCRSAATACAACARRRSCSGSPRRTSVPPEGDAALHARLVRDDGDVRVEREVDLLGVAAADVQVIEGGQPRRLPIAFLTRLFQLTLPIALRAALPSCSS